MQLGPILERACVQFLQKKVKKGGKNGLNIWKIGQKYTIF